MPRPEPTQEEKIVTSVDLIVSKSDAEGKITYTNPIFMKISGYSPSELLEKPHSILRHPDMPKAIFQYLWENIKEGRDIVAYVKNLCKDGSFYWILATVKVAKNPDGTFRNYMSTRRSITDAAKESISALYAQLIEVEKSNGAEASYEALLNFLSDNSIVDSNSFNEFMLKLNK